MTGRSWTSKRDRKKHRLSIAGALADRSVVATESVSELLRAVIAPGDRIVLEGDNQKQADFLSRALARLDPAEIYGLHMVISSVSRPEHLDIFENGLARTLDFAYAGPQSSRIPALIADDTVRVGAIHTYLELYARLFTDLVPDVALVAAEAADRDGNLYTGANTEETPTIVEATAFRNGIVIAQVNEIVETGALPRIDIPGGWVDFVVQADRPYAIEPLFTRDPAQITDMHVLLAMLAIRGVYERHEIESVNHGIGFDTAAIELLLPTFGESLGLRGRIARRFVLNPHPTLIPAIESGWVDTVTSFGGELGMEDYVRARPDVFATGPDGSLRSNRMNAQVAGLYATDMFIGSTLQLDADANSSTVVNDRLSGFGGAPNLGSDARGRRHPTAAWLGMSEPALGSEPTIRRGRKLVVQIAESFGVGNVPKYVDRLDAIDIGREAGMSQAPVMIYGDDVTHLISEEGVAYLYLANSAEERRQAVAALAGAGPLGRTVSESDRRVLRRDGILATPADLGVDPAQAGRHLLAADSIEDLVAWSGGLYKPPARFRKW
ncbi:malonate decarboxylase subunit alpha [Nocardia sp. NPDC005825]|uniref:malonate decarboxylase subunit alpha n=1 Tax=unclassified Nocardia TaxID=2637762 RepID=UPI0033D03938